MTDNQNDQAAAGQQAQGPQFGVQKTYVKDISFETPMGVKVFTQSFAPKINLDVNTSGNAVAENVHEVVLRLTVTAKIEEETAYIIEVEQASIFSISGFPEEQMKHLLGAVCPNFLFPYAREVVDSTVVRGGFPPLNLAPVDFDALFRNAQNAESGGESPTIN